MLGVMDLEELRGFLAVVEAGSLLGAATRLGIPRGTLRRRIDSLEARAGVPLLERSAQGVVATEAGRVLAERGHRLIEEGAALIAAAREIGREPGGTLRVRLPIGLPPAVLVAYGELVRVAVPRLAVRLHACEAPFSGRLDDVDLVIGFGERAPPGSWLVSELLRVPVRILASPEYLARHGEPRSVAELAAHPLASWVAPGGAPDRWPLRAGGSVAVAPVMVSNDPHMLRQHARAGLVLVLVPDADLDLLGLPVDELAPVLEQEVGGSVALELGMPAALADSPRIARVVGMIRQLLARAERHGLATPPDPSRAATASRRARGPGKIAGLQSNRRTTGTSTSTSGDGDAAGADPGASFSARPGGASSPPASHARHRIHHRSEEDL